VKLLAVNTAVALIAEFTVPVTVWLAGEIEGPAATLNERLALDRAAILEEPPNFVAVNT
jgi:hypothetical protein